jgi:hypothetical protein
MTILRSFSLHMGRMYLCLSQVTAFIARRSDENGVGAQGINRAVEVVLQIHLLVVQTRDR